jgi:hypothetical protein
MARSIVKTAVAASTVLKEQYMVTNVVSTAHFRDRSIAIVPRRVG